jgi:hypothetical protein
MMMTKRRKPPKRYLKAKQTEIEIKKVYKSLGNLIVYDRGVTEG